MGPQTDGQFISAFQNCDWDKSFDREIWKEVGGNSHRTWTMWDYLWCIGRNVERLFKHHHRQFGDKPFLSKKLIDFNCERTLKIIPLQTQLIVSFLDFFQNVMINLLIPMETIA